MTSSVKAMAYQFSYHLSPIFNINFNYQAGKHVRCSEPLS